MPAYRSTQRVYFDDLDALNILHNVRFLLFIERARGELFNTLGFRWQDDLETNPDKVHVIAEHQISYLKPVQGEGELVVDLDPIKLGRTSFILRAEVRSPDESTLYATSTTRLVRLSHDDRTPCPWSDKFRKAVTPLLAKD